MAGSQSEIKPGPRGFGAGRFVVRGRIYAPEDATLRLTDLVDDLPERWPINPAFPYPWARGGSRPRTGDGGDGGELPSPVEPYPPGRSRPDRDPGPVGGDLPPDAGGPGGILNPCLTPNGMFWTSHQVIAAATTQVNVTSRIPRPFVIRHIQGHINSADLVNASISVRIARDNDTSGGAATSGANPEEYGLSATLFNAVNVMEDIYPNITVWESGMFLKIIQVNGTAGGLNFTCNISVEFLG